MVLKMSLRSLLVKVFICSYCSNSLTQVPLVVFQMVYNMQLGLRFCNAPHQVNDVIPCSTVPMLSTLYTTVAKELCMRLTIYRKPKILMLKTMELRDIRCRCIFQFFQFVIYYFVFLVLFQPSVFLFTGPAIEILAIHAKLGGWYYLPFLRARFAHFFYEVDGVLHIIN